MLEFEPDNSKAGYRLHRLEVLNWGTFHQGTIAPGGYTSLLTGANGSGKSTLVDALLTLLVPSIKRNYNLASGSEKGKRDRDEKTYVLGAYSTIKSEDDHKSKPKYLRTKDDYSVLLAYFYNKGCEQHVTLAQVLCVKEKVEKLFVVAAGELSIAAHFNNFESFPELKKQLASLFQPKIETFDTFVDYSKHFRKTFGVESEKAFDLFNQTVSIKEIGELNEFVRGHMLDKINVEEEIQKLNKHYENLTFSHEKLQKAKKQVEILKPLIADSDQYENVQGNLDELKEVLRVVPAYFAQRKIGLLQTVMVEKQQEHTQVNHDLVEINGALKRLKEQELNLKVDIKNDDKGRQIKDLEQDIKTLEGQIYNYIIAAKKYNKIAEGIGFPAYSDRDTFNSSAIQAEERQKTVTEEITKLRSQRDEETSKKKQRENIYTELDKELQSLKQRKNQIPGVNVQLRKKILTALEIAEAEIAEEEIPFVGELLKVKDGEGEWEGAIEKLLHNFGLRLLVPERHYHKFTKYVDRTNLGRRVVYEKLSTKNLHQETRNLDKNSLFNKLDIKPDNEYITWLTNDLLNTFGSCICCEDLDRFERENYAIRKNGLMKKGNRHEKDDRHRINDKSQYILGWDNSEKIKDCEAKLQECQAEIDIVKKAIKEIETAQEKCEDQKKLLEKLLEFNNFSAIDWKPDASKKQKLVEQKQELEESCDRLNDLKIRLAAVSADIQTKEADKTSADKKIAVLDRDIEHYQQQREECDRLSTSCTSEKIQTYTPKIEDSLKNPNLTLLNIDPSEAEVKESYQSQINDASKLTSSLERSIDKQMDSYKREYPEETTNVDASLEALPEFKKMLARIEGDDLPAHEQKFKELLDRQISDAISNFNDLLEDWKSEIEQKIYEINQSLKVIEYTDSTYIQVQSEINRDNQIKEFKNQLKVLCYRDVGVEQTSEADEASFEKIKDLIDRLKSDKRWTEKVTDVREWLNFSVSVKNKDDHTQKEYYSDSSGKSGGQKAKLAYTILASAIAHQFGLVQDKTKSESFRLVVIDEAFSKLDEENAKYAMELFKQLNLQLLVVTPKDKIYVVEDYVGSAYYVENSREENDSKVYNISLEKLRLKQMASN
ncbi:SbcC/MukB-like Walker B domain-containing protein [Microcoleus sp. D2_18a_B4]|uniref:SbcC/MukB-like Walker B domain-containing protein n=1 Tax=Microcoleus sp. D2_18a_B4 TaxID=3055329 RepID=UPI002FD6C09E